VYEEKRITENQFVIIGYSMARISFIAKPFSHFHPSLYVVTVQHDCYRPSWSNMKHITASTTGWVV